MVDSINNVNQYMEGKTESDLVSNSMLFFAVVKNIEIVGEASLESLISFASFVLMYFARNLPISASFIIFALCFK